MKRAGKIVRGPLSDEKILSSHCWAIIKHQKTRLWTLTEITPLLPNVPASKLANATAVATITLWGWHWDKATHIPRYFKTGVSRIDVTHWHSGNPQFYSIYMEITTGNIPDTVVILIVFRSPVFWCFVIAQQRLDRIFSSERGPLIIFPSLFIPNFFDYLVNLWLKTLHPPEDPLVFCKLYLI